MEYIDILISPEKSLSYICQKKSINQYNKTSSSHEDQMKLSNFKIIKEQTVLIDYIQDITIQSQHRSGVIVYRRLNDEYIFGLGIDTQSGDITDFGGGVQHQDNLPIVVGLREFTEETLGVFGHFSAEEVIKSLVIYSDSLMIMFLHLDFNFNAINKLFDYRRKKIKHTEIDKLIWFDKRQFLNLIEGNATSSLYIKVKEILIKGIEKYGDFTEYL